MHGYDESAERLSEAVLDYAQRRLKLDPVPLDGPLTPAELDAAAGQTITPDGLGPAALDIFARVLAPACVSIDHPRFLSFIPCAPAPCGLSALVRPAARGQLRVRGPHRPPGRDRGEARDREPAHHQRRYHRHSRHHGLTGRSRAAQQVRRRRGSAGGVTLSASGHAAWRAPRAARTWATGVSTRLAWPWRGRRGWPSAR